MTEVALDHRRLQSSRRLPRPLFAAIVAAVLLTACGEPPVSDDAPQPRVASATLDGAVYTVRVARELDPRDPGDRAFLEGRTAAADNALLGIFMGVCNATDGRVDTVERVRLVGDAGPTGSRISPPANGVAYQPLELGEGECVPPSQSVAARLGSGLLVLFEVPRRALEDRSLRLLIESADGGGRRLIPVRLDRRR